MDEKDLKFLAKRGLSLLRLDSDDWEAVEETRHLGTRFSLTFPHEVARNGRSQSAALIAVSGPVPRLRIGFVRSIQAISTFDSVFDFVHPILPATLDGLLAQVTERSLRSGAAKLGADETRFRSVSAKLSARIIELIAALPDNVPAVQRILSSAQRPRRFENARALQQDAVSLALKVFGLAEVADEVDLPGGDTALAAIRIQEDAVIEHDARWIPGWRLVDSDLTGRAVFTRRDARLEVFTANKRPLEELFGVDLIYLNQPRGALVMVQYKMMEPIERSRQRVTRGWLEYDEVGEQEWAVPVNSQFKDEIARMERFDRDLALAGPYRLNSGPFYFKLIKRRAATNTAGIVLSLDHLKQMISEGKAKGPRGGLRISYQALNGHYLRSDPFIDLVRSGYIGTRGATTEHLQSLIDATLTGGRAVVAAIQSAIGHELRPAAGQARF
jgi:hypothetical protein